MLDKVDLSCKLTKKEYKTTISKLQKKLEQLQRIIADKKIPVIIIFDGWSAAGKGEMISNLVAPLDPREFNVYALEKQNEEEQMHSFLWSFWIKTPLRGRITIYDRSWHRCMSPDDGYTLSEKERKGFYYDINAFERQLTDDGFLIIKLFLHIGRDEQTRRFKILASDPLTSWRVGQKDKEQNKNYDSYLNHFDEIMANTQGDQCEWTVIAANDQKYAAVKMYETIIDTVECEIERSSNREAEENQRQTGISFPKRNDRLLSDVNLNNEIDSEIYKKKLLHYQSKLEKLEHLLYVKRRSVVIVYEGWDAAGKGGNIKRLTEMMDPRGYEVVPISAPTYDEKNHHYLWRFYNKMPKDGHFTIFDRSWYGRVLVERVEGLCTPAEWSRAYREINDMESHLANHGTIVIKFWLHIDKNEQLRRFTDRQNDPDKQYKITDEDWRNRDKWDSYERAVIDMLSLCDKSVAPWVIVESNDKKYARIKVLECVVHELEKKL